MIALSLLSLISACASSPEIPEEVSRQPASVSKNKPLIDDEMMKDLKTSRRWNKAVQRRIASRVRQLRQDCKIYQKPTLMSPNVSTVESGRDVWTEDTDTSWFRVYKDKSYGYISKICF